MTRAGTASTTPGTVIGRCTGCSLTSATAKALRSGDAAGTERKAPW
ncbi:MAG: hypothetical protein H7306_19400 [Bacteriovorax sp.]|nr:hypothetical protein [Rhizobacter sp.]